MRTIAIVNQKGGSGKTTTAINVAAVFAQRGARTLLVDTDPQSHCAAGLGVPEERIDFSLAEALLTDIPSPTQLRKLRWEVSRNLDLIPSTMRLAGAEAPGGGLHQKPDKDRRLLHLLEHLKPYYDVCLVDCPPTIGLLTYNALRAARETLVPVETGYFAMKGAERQWGTILNLIERLDRPIAVHLLATLHRPESRISCDVLRALERKFAGQIVPVVIYDHEELREAASFGQPISEYAPHSKARENFERLVGWLEKHAPALDDRPTAIEITPDPPSIRHDGANRPTDAQALRQIGVTIPRPVSDARPDIRIPAFDPGALPDGNRAAELVRRVRQIALANAERAKHLQEVVAQNISAAEAASLSSEAPAETATPPAHGAAHVAMTPRFAPAGDPLAPVHLRGAFFQTGEPDTLDTPSRPRVFDTATIASGESDETVDNSAESRRGSAPLIMTEPKPHTPHRSRSVQHLFGVSRTSRGMLFLQPLELGRSVAVAGEFNDWSPTAHRLRRNDDLGVHETVIPLPAGTHQYRLVIDGRWCADPHNSRSRANAYGEANSVVEVHGERLEQVGAAANGVPSHVWANNRAAVHARTERIDAGLRNDRPDRPEIVTTTALTLYRAEPELPIRF